MMGEYLFSSLLKFGWIISIGVIISVVRYFGEKESSTQFNHFHADSDASVYSLPIRFGRHHFEPPNHNE